MYIDDELKYKKPELFDEYREVIEILETAKNKLNVCFDGENVNCILSDISNTIWRIKKDYLPL